MRVCHAALCAAVISCVSTLGGLSKHANAQSISYGEGWSLYAGGGLVYSPAYMGADHYQLSAFPDLRVRYEDRFFASVPEGIGYRLLHEEDWSVGPLVKYDFGRDEDGDSPFRVYGDSSDDLLGLGDVDGAPELGGFAEYRIGPFTAKGNLRQAIGGHEGLVSDIGIDFEAEYFGLGPPVFFTASTSLRLADTSYTESYFGISGEQSLASGLSEFEAAGGIVSFGAGAMGIIPLNEHVAALIFARYERLAGDAADSPIVTERGSPNAGIFGLFLSYGL